MSFRNHLNTEVAQGFSSLPAIRIPPTTPTSKVVSKLLLLDSSNELISEGATIEDLNGETITQEVLLYADYFKKYQPDSLNEMKLFGQVFSDSPKFGYMAAAENIYSGGAVAPGPTGLVVTAVASAVGAVNTTTASAPTGYKFQPMDYTGVDEFKRQVFQKYIKPWWTANIQNNTAYTDEARLLIKQWIEDPESLETMKERFGEIATGDAEWNNTATGLVILEGGSYTVQRDDFLNALLNNTTSPFVLEALGFDEVVDEADGIGAYNTEPPTIATLEMAIADGYGRAIGAIKEAVGNIDLTDEDILGLRQCALITFLLHKQVIKGSTRTMMEYFRDGDSMSPLFASSYKKTDEYNYRIYPVVPDASEFDPNQLVNICTISSELKTVVAESSSDSGPTLMDKYLYWVYSGKNSKLMEVEIPLSSNQKQAARGKKLNAIRNAGAILQGAPSNPRAKNKAKQALDGYKYNNIQIPTDLSELQRIAESLYTEYTNERNTAKQGYYYLNDIKITFDGTNPSTARNDVKVEFSFTLSSLAELNKIILHGDTIGDLDDSVDLRLMDLITLPVTQTTETKKVAGGFIPNQFSPDYNRIRLKVKAQGDNTSNLILDLTTIDHSLSRNSDTGETNLSINYRGYFESVLNMPHNDALAGPDELKLRKKVRDDMKELNDSTNGCSPDTIRSALRMQQSLLNRMGRDRSARTIISRLFDQHLVHDYILDPAEIRLLDAYVNARKKYVKEVTFSQSTLQSSQVLQLLDEIAAGDDADEDKIKNLKSKLKNKFFFLGDLMAIVTDCLYQDGTSTHREQAEHLNMKFIVGTCFVPDPSNLSAPAMVINPVSLPVDLLFFVEWFNSTIISKGISFYPVGTFIRDLIERLVNGIIYDTCFSLTLPDENPPIFRSQVFTSTDQNWLLKQPDGFLHPLDTNGDLTNDNPTILMPKNVPVPLYGEGSKEVNTTHYSVIYQQFPSFLRQMKLGAQSAPLRDTDYVPTIIYGTGNTKHNFVNNVKFSKTNSPGLREARYFNTNYGSLSLLSNVYDLSFDFYRKVGNTLFYPGVVVNFVLTDWADGLPLSGDVHPGTKVTTLVSSSAGGIPTSDYSFLGDSNPHKAGTMANIVGMGGYYIIKSVQYILGQSQEEFEIKISTKFLGNDGKNGAGRESTEEKIVENKQKCVDIYNDMATRTNSLLGEDDDVFFPQLPNVGTATNVNNQAANGTVPHQQQQQQQQNPASNHPLENYYVNNSQDYGILTSAEISNLTLYSRADLGTLGSQMKAALASSNASNSGGEITLVVHEKSTDVYYEVKMDSQNKVTVSVKATVP